MSAFCVKLLYLFGIIECFSSLIFDGCNESLWSESYYSSRIFPSSHNNLANYCMIIPFHDVTADDNILPTLWFHIGSENDIYYDISYNISCILIDENINNEFYVIFRVKSLFDAVNFEFNTNTFSGYSFSSNCGRDNNKIKVLQHPSLQTLDENNNYNHHEFNLNDGEIYNIQIIVGDKSNNDPTYHRIYVNNKLVLDFYDNNVLYGGIGISSFSQHIQKGIDIITNTLYIDNFIVNGIGFDAFDDAANCEDIGKIKHINWMDLSRDSSLKPNIDFQIGVDDLALTLYIRVEMDYIGLSYGDRLETYGYGTTYVLDFESFDSHKNSINEPGSCSNRISQSFENVDFKDWWNYSKYPYLNNQIGEIDTFLSYPLPSKYWYVYMKHGQCTPIVYEAEFNLNDLRECGAYNDTRKYLKFINNDKWMNISGTFYVDLISPMNKDIDIGYYYVYQLLSSPFLISIKKTINIFSSTGISLFTLTFVAISKQDNERKYRLILLTESADFLFLSVNQLIDAPDPSLKILESTESNNNCLALRNNICSQLFEIYAYPVDCANAVLSGQYGIRFNISCNPLLTESDYGFKQCHNWLDSKIEDVEDNTVSLFVDLEWKDTICDTEIYLIEFNAEMLFYIDDNFNNLQTDNRNGYEIGIDRVYIAIKLNFKDTTYNILDTHLMNVWLCTVDEQYENNDAFIVSNDGQNGGCFAADIIDENQPYFIIQNNQIGVGYDELKTIIYDNNINNNEVRFSFIVPSDIIRSKLYIHAQIQMQLTDENKKEIVGPNRRLLIENNVQDTIRHFMGYTQMINTQQNILATHNKLFEWINPKTLLFGIILSILISIIIIVSISKRRINQRNSRINRYEINETNPTNINQ